MDRAKTRCFGQVLLGCALLLTIVGCGCPPSRHGVRIRGGWSLELNRVPWLVSRTESQQECSVPNDGCPAACLPDGAVPAEVRGQGPAATGLGAGCLGCGRLWGVGESTAECYGQPRFHPGPTRPVFQPPIESDPSVAGPEQEESGAADASRGQTDPSLGPPGVELILAPDPDPPEEAEQAKPAANQGEASGSAGAPASSKIELKVSEVGPSGPDKRAASRWMTP